MDTPDATLLSSLTRLMTQWSSLALHAEYARAAGVSIEPVDVTPLYLIGLGGPRRASLLADDLRQSRPTTSKQLNRLEAAGLITRTADPEDGRATIVALTDRGTRAFTALYDRGLAVIGTVLGEFSADERRQLASLVSRFVATATTVMPPTAATVPATATSPQGEEQS